MITVLTCRGTGEPVGAPDNMLASVTRRLDPAIYRIGPDVDYPASVGPVNPQQNALGCSEEASIERGVAALSDAVARISTPVGILGYSLGAEVVTRFLESKARGDFRNCWISWAANIANPLRQEGDSIDPDPVGYGINGRHGPWPADIPVWEVANPADGITSCPVDSPLRTLADAASAFSFAELGGWTTALADRVRGNRWQPNRSEWWRDPVGTWMRWNRAAGLIDGYLTGAHTLAYETGGYCQRLAAILNATK